MLTISLKILTIILALALLIAGLVILFFVLILYRLAGDSDRDISVKQEEESLPYTLAPAFSMADITDEDMMVAALIATIDYADQTKKDVRLLSIRQIG